MTPSLAVQFSAAADGRSLTIDQDCQLVGVSAPVNKNVVVSRDSTTTIANSVTAPSNVLDENILAIAAGYFVPTLVPLLSGDRIFVSCSGAGSAVLYLLIPT